MVFSRKVRKASFLVAFVAAVSLVFAVGEGSAREAEVFGEPGREFVAGEIIVKLEDDATDGDLERINERNDAETKEELPESDVAVVDLPRDLPVGEAVETYESSPDVEYAEPDYILRPRKTPNDTDYPSLHGLHNTGQTRGTPDADIDAPEAWNTTTGNQETIVAVIDTGVDINHPDLRENIWTNPDEIPGNGRDDDGNGYEDDVNGWDFASNNASVYDSPTFDDHGTHVAGTIAARGDNRTGVVGVNWRASIMPLKFLGADTGRTSDAIGAINYAVAEGATISNNSWGGSGYSQSLRDAIANAEKADHLFVAAAGNDGSNNDATPSYPDSYDLPNIISVAATTHRDALASYSNYGAASVDLAAPGSGIRSTMPDDSYDMKSGTSMATPHVAGVAALIESENPGLGYSVMKARILDSVDEKAGLSGKVLTGGRLNAAGALASGATNYESPVSVMSPDTAAPAISPVKPRPGSRTKRRNVRIVASVRDDRTRLASGNVRVYVNGRPRSVSYDPNDGRLVASSGKLARKSHTIKIVATDAAGNTNTRTWRFKVTRR